MWGEDNYIANLLGQTNGMNPSFMKAPVPGGNNVLAQIGGTQPGSMGGPAGIERQAGVPPQRQRASLIDILGGLADGVAEIGGVQPGYQPTIDARTRREREAELYPLEKQAAVLDNQKSQVDMRVKQQGVLGQMLAGTRQVYERFGPEGLAKAWPTVAQQLGMAGLPPEEIQGIGAAFQQNPEQAFMVFEGLMGEQSGPEYKVVGNDLVRLDGNDVSVAHTGSKAPGAVRQVQVDGPEGPGLYNFDSEGNNLGKVGGVVRAPTQPRQPTLADQKYRYLVDQGVPEPRARAIALGLEAAPGKGKGGNSKYEQDQKRRTDALGMVNTQIDRLLAGDDVQERSGLDTAITKLARPIAGFFGGTTGEETTRLETELALLKQNIREVVNPESNYESKVFWERLEPLFPKVDAGSSAQVIRNKLVTIRKLLNEQPGQSETTPPPATQPAATPSGSDDPLGLFE